jgi:LacI family transcriptional regulator
MSGLEHGAAEVGGSKLEQIAAEVGVSANTVLRVLRRENKEVWPSAVKRAEEIRKLAQKVGYLPNGSARAMRRGKFNAIALVLSTDRGRSYLPNDLFNGIHDAVNALSMRMIVSKLGDKELTSAKLMPAVLREWSCDGLLINYTDRVPEQMIRLIEKFHIPSIWINRKQRSEAVYYDDFGGAREATQRLLNLGHQRITYLDFLSKETWSNTHYSRTDRYAGYAEAMREAGLTPTPREQFAGVPAAERLSATCQLLRGAGRPTALIGYDAGVRIMHAAAVVKLRVPQDLSVLTFEPLPAASAVQDQAEAFMGWTIGSMGVPGEQAGHRAVEMLTQKIAARDDAIPSVVLPLKFNPGDTCGPVPAEA